MKNNLLVCTSCGAAVDVEATAGLCPRCLMAGAMIPTEDKPNLSSTLGS